jgi:hypothetical protein
VDDYHVAWLHLPEGGERLSGKDDCRDGGGDATRPRRPSGSVPPDNPHGGFILISAPPRPEGSGYGDMPPPLFRHPLPFTYLYVESMGPGGRGGPLSKHGCSVDAQSEGGGYGRTSDYHTCTRVPNIGKTGKMSGKIYARGGTSASFSLYLCVSVPPTCTRGDGGPRQGGSSRRWERQRPWGGASGMRPRDQRATT